MVVCHCYAVSDRAVRAAIRSGVDSVEALSAHCAAGTDCGGCQPVLEELLDEHRRDRARSLPHHEPTPALAR